VAESDESSFGHDPFVFDDRKICELEAAVLGSAFLTWETWKVHSTEHPGEPRHYFAEFRQNREAIIETLREPASVREVSYKAKPEYWFQAIKTIIYMKTPGGTVFSKELPFSVIVDSDKRIRSFFQTPKPQTKGKAIYP